MLELRAELMTYCPSLDGAVIDEKSVKLKSDETTAIPVGEKNFKGPRISLLKRRPR